MGGIDLADVRVSFQVAATATLVSIIIGIPLAWALARINFPGKALATSLAVVPLALPPTVVGYYLLRILGHNGPIGQMLERLGWEIVFTWQGAAIAAAVVACPLVIITAQAGFAQVDMELERVAATLGRFPLSIFRTVTLPLAMRSIAAGIVLAFARAMGEFGATLMVAGAIPGKTRTMSIAVYELVQAGESAKANATALALLGISLASIALFISLTSFTRR